MQMFFFLSGYDLEKFTPGGYEFSLLIEGCAFPLPSGSRKAMSCIHKTAVLVLLLMIFDDAYFLTSSPIELAQLYK